VIDLKPYQRVLIWGEPGVVVLVGDSWIMAITEAVLLTNSKRPPIASLITEREIPIYIRAIDAVSQLATLARDTKGKRKRRTRRLAEARQFAIDLMNSGRRTTHPAPRH